MNALHQIGDSLTHAWDSMAEGWRQLRERAGSALTRFHPLPQKTNLETREERQMRNAAGWGVLAADLRETATEIRVLLEVPGLDTDQFDLHVEGNTLWIRGEKHLQRESDEGQFHILECAYGAFERGIPLPAEVDDAAAKARYRRGVLDITLPKTRASQGHRITVKG